MARKPISYFETDRIKSGKMTIVKGVTKFSYHCAVQDAYKNLVDAYFKLVSLNKVRTTGKSTCSDDDEYNLIKGVALASRRGQCMGNREFKTMFQDIKKKALNLVLEIDKAMLLLDEDFVKYKNEIAEAKK